MNDPNAELLESLMEKLQSGEIRLKMADIPYPPDEWKAWQRNRCGRYMREWLERTEQANGNRLKQEAGIPLYRAQGASEVLDALRALLLEQVDPERAPDAEREETEDADSSD